jgi:cell division transport system permease protein
MGRLIFFIREALRALRRSAAPSLAAIVTIVVTVLLLGVLVPVLYSTQSKTEDVREQIAVEVFFHPEVSRNRAEGLEPKIEQIPHVESASFVSKNEGLNRLRRDLESDSQEDLVEELPGNSNPLPHAFDVELDNPDNLESVITSLAPPDAAGAPKPFSPLIEEAKSAGEASEIRSVTGAVKIILAVIAGLLLIASLMLVGNTIRLSIYARRREVEVMHLVGATRWFIRWPFIIEGLIVGFLGAASAVAILTLGKVTIVDPLSERFALVDNLDTVDFVPLVAVLVACAMLVAALGSGITLRRFLRV